MTIKNEILVVVFLRGGCDGLNLVGPAGDDDYISERYPDVRVARKGDAPGHVLDNPLADVDFRLHPEAKGLKALYDQGDLAVVHACGLTNGTRSHFEAMDYMERGDPGNKNLPTGWLARHLALQTLPGMLPVVSTSYEPPASLLGDTRAVSIPDPNSLGFVSYSPHSEVQKALVKKWYQGQGVPYAAGKRTLGMVDTVAGKIARDANGTPVPYQPEHGAAYPDGTEIASGLRSVAQLIKMDLGMQFATVDYGGWDTHINQAGYFPSLVQVLSGALAAFAKDMQAYWDRMTVVVMSEFGRRLKSNESYGTDHGYGNVMLVLGGNVNGRKMYGKWPGLSREKLDDGADLAVTTDYRVVLAEILEKRLGNRAISTVFPHFQDYTPLGLIIPRDPVPAAPV